MGQANHRIDDGACIAAGLEVLHKAAVDLELLGWQLAQVAETGIPGAEVVD